MKCTDPLPLPCCCPDAEVSPAGLNDVVMVKGPSPGEVRMNNHACCPSGTVTGRLSDEAQRPAFVPLPVQVTVPVEAPDGDATTKPNETLRATALAAMAAAVLKGVQSPLTIFISSLSSPSRQVGDHSKGVRSHCERHVWV
jgi:hypothetical protein